jgi:hypothetical protein
LFPSRRPISGVPAALIVLLFAQLFALTCASAQTLAVSTPPAVPTPGTPSAAVTAATPAMPGTTETPFSGLNLSLNENLEHDSSTGWSDSLTPDVSLRLGKHFSFDANVPWFLSLAAYVPTTVNGVTTTTLGQIHNVIGDASATAHFGASQNDFNYSAGAVVGFSTGDKSLGIGAGSTTYHFGNHAEYSIGPFTPDIEAGIGNSSAFANPTVHKSYTAVGGMANFQAGSSIDLPMKLSLDLEGYESMPVQLQSIFGTIRRRGNHNHAGGKKTVQGATGSGEDNGITADLGFPLTRKVTFSASYDRSFIQADDIVGFSLNWTLRTPKKIETGAPASPLSRVGN